MHRSIQNSEFFRGLGEAQIELLMAEAKVRAFNRGDWVLQQSGESDAVLFILAGRTEVLVSQVGREANMEVIAVIGAGELIGERALLGERRRSASVRARDDVHALQWQAASLDRVFKEHQEIGYIVMSGLARKLSDRLAAANNNLRNALTAQALI